MNKKLATMVAAIIMLVLRMCSPSDDGDVNIDPEQTNPVESNYCEEVETTQDPANDETTPPTEKEDDAGTTLPQPEPETSIPTEPETGTTAPTEPGLEDTELPPV